MHACLLLALLGANENFVGSKLGSASYHCCTDWLPWWSKLIYSLVLRDYDHKRKLASHLTTMDEQHPCGCHLLLQKPLKTSFTISCGCSTCMEWKKYMQPSLAQYGSISVKWFFDPFTHYTWPRKCFPSLVVMYHHILHQPSNAL